MLRERVLIIYDNVEEIEQLRQSLESLGFDPEIVLQPELAREVMLERTMSAVILDLDRAKLGPYELVKKLHEEAPALPILGMSAKGAKTVLTRLKRHGGTAVLKKPIETEQLGKDLERALRPPKAASRSRRSAHR